MMTSADIRKAFLEYFRERGHEIVASSPLVPGNDPTLLFTNAGMVQFKDVFLGKDKRPYTRAVSSQRCVRAGGKHNDLENVGYTARHHTFFEMLGNFSFGDYFKEDAIHYAWEFLTQVLKLPAERLWITVFEEDPEAADIWLNKVGVSAERFSRIGAKDNFWSMGDTGPCGPCTEIFYDHGAEVAGGPPGSPDEDGDRYIEIWNLVFMQYDRAADGTMTPLPKPSVDTGMGLERLAAVMQHVHSNYEIDTFQHLIKAAARLAKCQDLENSSLRVIADHIRACSFLVIDGVVPSNEGRGYVLRRIIRRAIRHGNKLGMPENFFHQLVGPLCEVMGEAYPELVKSREIVERILRQEEQRFAETLEQGLQILEQAIAGLTGKVIPGETVFRLYDTYGFPVDLTADIARERHLEVDHEGFDREMNAQRERARAASQFDVGYSHKIEIDATTEFTGYQQLQQTAKVIALFKEGQAVDRVNAGEQAMVILDKTSFYAESGGQTGDRGRLIANGVCFEVRDTQKQGPEVIAHFGMVTQGVITLACELAAEVDVAQRARIERNHSATHLLHAALRKVLGDHVTQKGSLVEAERMRFDFAHFEAVTPQQLREIERLVNEQIRLNHAVETRVMTPDEAVADGAMALFGEKYGESVRVLFMGGFSTELCGGTHVGRTGDIGLFKIIAEGGVAAGVRRIEGVTGEGAQRWLEETESALTELAALTKSSRELVVDKVAQLLERTRQLEKELDRLKSKLASAAGSDLASQAIDIKGAKVLVANLEGVDAKALRDTLDQLKNKLGSAIVVLAAVVDGKVSLAAGVTNDLTDRVKAGELVSYVATQVGGKGGGRPDMAMAGGSDVSALPAALASVADWVDNKM